MLRYKDDSLFFSGIKGELGDTGDQGNIGKTGPFGKKGKPCFISLSQQFKANQAYL